MPCSRVKAHSINIAAPVAMHEPTSRFYELWNATVGAFTRHLLHPTASGGQPSIHSEAPGFFLSTCRR